LVEKVFEMANDGKFLNITAGKPTQEAAVATSAGAGDANKIPKLDGGGKLDITLLPAGLGAETRSVVASEALSAGDLVNFHNNTGTVNMRKADADVAGREAHGFVLSAVSSSASGTVYPEENVVTGLSGLTPGATQFLSATAGARTETAPSTSGNYVQIVGVALSSTEMLFRPETPILLA
jgi:hypothetical protein